MNFNDLSQVVPWVIAHGYLIFWIIATIEGPITTIAGGVAASLGYFNFFIILLLAIAADVGGDVVYYWFGFSVHNLKNLWLFRILGFGSKRLERLREMLHKHTRKAMILVKVSPFIGPLGIVVVGMVRLKFKKFFKAALEIGLPKSLFFVLLGYYSGQSYLELSKVINRNQYIILGIGLLVALIYFVYIRIMARISRNLLK